jgi:hypothetical protein
MGAAFVCVAEHKTTKATNMSLIFLIFHVLCDELTSKQRKHILAAIYKPKNKDT